MVGGLRRLCLFILWEYMLSVWMCVVSMVEVVIWYLNINFEVREIGQVFGVGKVGGIIPGLVK